MTGGSNGDLPKIENRGKAPKAVASVTKAYEHALRALCVKDRDDYRDFGASNQGSRDAVRRRLALLAPREWHRRNCNRPLSAPAVPLETPQLSPTIFRTSPQRSSSFGVIAQSAERVMDDEKKLELQDQIMRYRMMERDVTDRLALSLLHDIVAELEAALQDLNEFRDARPV